MRTVLIVGDLKFDNSLDKVIDILSADCVDYPNYPSTMTDSVFDDEDVLAVLQYGNLTEGHMDIVDRAIELGVPVLEYK